MSLGGRSLALQALSLCRKPGYHSERVLNSVLNTSLDNREKALCTRLFYSVIQNKLYIDYLISGCCHTPLNKLQPQVLDIIRICCAQILFFDKIPDFSAVSESVLLCRQVAPKASGLVNAVCRKLCSSDNHKSLPNNAVKSLSIRYSHPEWFTQRMLSIFGNIEECAAFLSANNSVPPIYLRRNTLLFGDGVYPSEAYLDYRPEYDCYTVPSMNDTVLKLLKDGLLYVQDPASAAAVIAAGPKEGMTVLDICSAPGGKSFTSAMLMGGTGRILSFDVTEKKVSEISTQSERLGIKILSAKCADGRNNISSLNGSADIVFTDVPCSGFGVIRKKPEIREKSAEEIAPLPKIGLAILSNASNYVKPGGVLLYSTCTVFPEENEEVIRSFLSENSSFKLCSFKVFGRDVTSGMTTLYPHRDGTDGFFICKMVRT